MTNGAWRLAKSIESGKTYIVVSTATDKALANKRKPAVSGVAPRSLARMPVIVSDNTITFVPDGGGVAVEQENLKFIFTDRTSVPPGRYAPPAKFAANQIGYTMQSYVHATAAYPQMMFMSTTTTNATNYFNNQFELTTRCNTSSESPGLADRALDQAVWFNTGIDPKTGVTKMFLYTASEDQYYVLKEVEEGASQTSTNATENLIPTVGGFVALRSSNPEDGTPVRLYEYVIEPYGDSGISGFFKDGKLPEGAVETEKGLKYTEMFENKAVILSDKMLDGWKIKEVTPVCDNDWKSELKDGELVIKFIHEAYDQVVTVTLVNTISGEEREIEIDFSGEKESLFDRIWGKFGCNAGFALLFILAFCPLILRRK
jgi:hypothetical protein